MNPQIQELIDEISNNLDLLARYLDLEVSEKRLEQLNEQCEAPDLWNDQALASKLLKERTFIENSLNNFNKSKQQLKDNIELIELAEIEGDTEILQESELIIEKLSKKIKQQKIECLFAGEADANDCYLEIHAGAGGTESQDWADMLLRMYLRWAETHEFGTQIISRIDGEEVGAKSVTIKISGHNSYGWCKTESGVHRLVRISPFDSNSRRHTSFASVWVYPVIDDSIEIEIEEKDIRIDTYRASGAGGQHVNKTDSAVRMTHIPTNIVVQCQDSRSQHRNRADCLSMLKARLYEEELQKREEEANAEHQSKSDIGWGHQIRSYVLHPYQMIKDLRTSYETGNTQAVLDGDLDSFIMETLSFKASNSGN